MWLSSQIKTSGEYGQALAGLLAAIERFDDPTRPEQSQFWSWEVRLFRPRRRTFAFLVVAFGLAGLAAAVVPHNELADPAPLGNVALTILSAVFVIGLSVYSLVTSLSDPAKFASEYLDKACQIRKFTVLSALGLLLVVGGVILARERSLAATIVCGASIGAAIASIIGLTFIIREVARCTLSTESSVIASKYAATRLCSAFLREAYLGLWMAAHGALLEKWCRNLNAIKPPSDYMGQIFAAQNENTDTDYVSEEIGLQFSCETECGFLDYYQERLAKLDKLLYRRGGQLFLLPHMWTSGKEARLGLLRAKTEADLKELVAAVKNARLCRFVHDRVSSENDRFWDVIPAKLQLAMKACMNELDIQKMERLLAVLAQPVEALRAAWKHAVVRDWYKRNPQRPYMLVWFYLDAIRQVLDHTEWPIKPDTGHKARFAKVVCESVEERMKELFRNADYHTLQILVEVIPRIYIVLKHNEDPELSRMRGAMGFFYAFWSSLFDELPVGIESEDRKQLRLVLHEGIFRWLLVAVGEKDREMVDALCSAAGNLVYETK